MLETGNGADLQAVCRLEASRQTRSHLTDPAYLAPLMLVGHVAIIAACIVGLSSSARYADWPADPHASVLRNAALLLVGWFAVTLALSQAQFYRGTPDRIPTIEIGLLVPIAIGLAFLWTEGGRQLLGSGYSTWRWR